MSWMVLWIPLCGLGFALGMMLAWRRTRQRLQGRVDEVVSDEIRRQLSGHISREAQQLKQHAEDENGNS